MIILFTEFTDEVSADFMLRAIRRLVETHLVMLVVLRDEELETIAAAQLGIGAPVQDGDGGGGQGGGSGHGETDGRGDTAPRPSRRRLEHR